MADGRPSSGSERRRTPQSARGGRSCDGPPEPPDGDRHHRRGHKRRPLFWLLYGLWCAAYVVALDLVVHQGLLLLAGRETLNQRYYFDPQIGRLLVPNFSSSVPWPEYRKKTVVFRTNNRGLREDADTPLATAAAHRIIVFGDSHTEGAVDNEDSFPHVAQRVLADHGIDAEVLNAGVGMFSLYQQLLFFERCLDLRPEIAVFVLYTGNDYVDLTLHTLFPYLTVENGVVVEHPPLSPAPSLRDFLSKRSALVSWLRRTLPRLNPRARSGVEKAQRLSAHAMGQSLFQAYYFTRLHPERLEETSRLQRYVVERIVEETRRNGVRTLFVVLPSKYQIERDADPALFSELERLLGLDDRRRFEDEVRRDFLRILSGAGADAVDPYEEFAEARARGGGELFWRSDHHLNDRGHRLLGRILAAKLEPMLGAGRQGGASRGSG